VIEWPMVFVGGLLGSAHCVGMCGTFVLALGSRKGGLASGLGRQLVYGLGRVFTYTCGGTVAGYAGWRLSGELRWLLNVHAVLAFLAGGLLIIQGLAATGVLPGPSWFSRRGPCLVPSLFAALLRETRLRSVFLGGVMNGLLPCGLVYAFLALAAGAGGPLQGGVTMLLFGLGTLPVLALVGCGARLLGRITRRTLSIAAWCVVLTGMLSIARGVEALRTVCDTEPPSCPLCR
jgi:sulfite exporter TauE/SafE